MSEYNINGASVGAAQIRSDETTWAYECKRRKFTNILKGKIHTDIHAIEHDVETISSRYASNLVKWYERIATNYGILDEYYKSNMYELLSTQASKGIDV